MAVVTGSAATPWSNTLRVLSRLRSVDCPQPAPGTDQLRVLQLTNMYPSQAQPNRGVFVRSQVESLAALGVACEVEEIQGYLSSANYMRALPLLPGRVRAGAYDLVHVHFGYTALAALGVRGVPLVVSFCGDDLLGRPDAHGRRSAKSLLLADLGRRAARRADAIIVKSDEMAQALGPMPCRMEVIPNGLDLALFTPMDRAAARAALGWPQDQAIALFPADPDEPRKNFRLAQAACERVRAKGRPLRLEWMFRRPQRDIVLGMAAADLMFSCSVQEGSPNAVKEAMAMNLPVLATDVGDCAQRLAGCMPSAVLPAEVDAFATAALRVLDAGPYRSNGRALVAPLALQNVAAQILAVYRHALGVHGRRQPVRA